jgi:hypothetical protein
VITRFPEVLNLIKESFKKSLIQNTYIGLEIKFLTAPMVSELLL